MTPAACLDFLTPMTEQSHRSVWPQSSVVVMLDSADGTAGIDVRDGGGGESASRFLEHVFLLRSKEDGDDFAMTSTSLRFVDEDVDKRR